MAKTRILLADDHAVLRAGLRLLLEAQPDLSVVGEAGDGAEALQLAAGLQPDLIVLDLAMPGLGGLGAIHRLRKAAASARILILTMHDDVSYLHRALNSGAAGYILKKAADAELLSAIRAVGRGEVYIHSAMTRALLEGLIPGVDPAESQEGETWRLLSDRERDVLRLVALGHTNAEIGEQLSLSIKTIETYRARGMEKLGLRSRAALVRYALGLGLLKDEGLSP